MTTTVWGQNFQDDAWYDPENAPVADMKTLGVKALRGMLEQAGTDYPGVLGTPNCISMMNTWATQLRAASIKPHIVVTFPNPAPSLPDTTTFAAQMAEQAAGSPGFWWEIGNELENPTLSGWAAKYTTFFGTVAAATKKADPTCKVGPSPVANINVGGWGDTWTQQCFQSGLGKINYDFHPVHCYSYPGNVPPADCMIYFDIPDYETRSAGWGRTVPVWITESGYSSYTSGSGNSYPEMTSELQKEYVLDLLSIYDTYDLPVVEMFVLADNLPGYSPPSEPWFGWQAASGTEDAPIYTPKSVYTAVSALWNTAPPSPPPVINYQQLYLQEKANYRAALLQIKNRDTELTSWMINNPKATGLAEMKKIIGEDAAWLAAHPSS